MRDDGWRTNDYGGIFNIFSSRGRKETFGEYYDKNYDKRLISSEIRDKMNKVNIPDLKLRKTENNKLFADKINVAKTENKNGWMVDGQTDESVIKYTKFISKDELAGVAIKPDGDITCVFKSEQSQMRGAVQDLIITARENCGTKMDCYGEPLVNMYEKCGFEPVARVKFDPKFAPPDFPKDPNYKPPNFIYFLKKTKKSSKQVVKDIKNNTYPQSDKTRLESLPEFDYKEAGKYRDSLI